MFYAIIARGPIHWYVTSESSSSAKDLIKVNNNIAEKSIVVKVDDGWEGLLKAITMIAKAEKSGIKIKQGIYDLTSETIKATQRKVQDGNA